MGKLKDDGTASILELFCIDLCDYANDDCCIATTGGPCHDLRDRYKLFVQQRKIEPSAEDRTVSWRVEELGASA